MVGELEVAPLAARLAGEEDHRALRIAEAGHQPVAGLERAGVVVEERLEPGAACRPAARARASRSAPKTSTFSPGSAVALSQLGAELHQRLRLLALAHVAALQLAGREGAHLDAPVADEAGGERVAVGEVGQERLGGDVLAGLEGRIVGGELAQLLRAPRPRRAAGEELAGHVGVGLVLLEPLRGSPASLVEGIGSTRERRR